MRKQRNKRRWLEYLFLIAGLAAIDYWIWVNVETNSYQASSNKNFDRSLRDAKPGTPAQPRVKPKPGEIVGRLEIPRLNLRVMVREGDDAGTLRNAAGHLPSTALPGDIGNVAFAAHRDTFFRPLRNIQKDDRIVVSTLQGTYEYVVESTAIVDPDDISVLKAAGRRELTLVTCYPFYYIGSAPHRFIVHATQVSGEQTAPANELKLSQVARRRSRRIAANQ